MGSTVRVLMHILEIFNKYKLLPKEGRKLRTIKTAFFIYAPAPWGLDSQQRSLAISLGNYTVKWWQLVHLEHRNFWACSL